MNRYTKSYNFGYLSTDDLSTNDRLKGNNRCLLSLIISYFVKKQPLNCNKQAATIKCTKLPHFFPLRPHPFKCWVPLTREISIQREGDGTGCAVVNQLWAWLILNHEKKISVKQQPILQLIDNCTCSSIHFPCIKVSLPLTVLYLRILKTFLKPIGTQCFVIKKKLLFE